MSKKSIKIFFFILLFSITTEGIYSSDIIRVGWYNMPGFQEGDSVENISGYNYEYLKKISQFAGWKYEFVFAPLKECLTLLKNGEIDILGNIIPDVEKLKNYNFTKKTTGTSNIVLATSNNRNDLFYDDFESFDGLRIAGVPSKLSLSILKKFADEHNISYEFQSYPTVSELLDAVSSGESDALISMSFNRLDGYKIISLLDSVSFYFAVNKDKTEILNIMNSAINEINSTNLFFEIDLLKKYFENTTSKAFVANTESEDEFIKNSGLIDVYVQSNAEPISYMKNGLLQGFVIDLFDKLSQNTGLRFNLIPKNSLERCIEAVKENKSGIVAFVPTNFTFGEENKLNITDSIFDSTEVLIYKSESEETNPSLGLSKDYYGDFNKFYDYNIIYYDSWIKCLQAVENDEIDYAICPIHLLEKETINPKYNDILFKVLTNSNLEYSLGVFDDGTEHLYPILEKALLSIPDSEIARFLNENLLNENRLSLLERVENHFEFLIIVITIILFLFTIILFQKINSRKMIKTKKQLEIKNVELESTQTELEIITTELNKALCVKNEFLSRMSHDMRTPLNAIINYSSFGIDETKEKFAYEYFTSILDSSEYLLEFLNDLLELQKLESDKIKFDKTIFDIFQLIESIEKMMLTPSKEKNLNFKTKIDINEECRYIYSDKHRLKQVLLNLITNAIKYTYSDGWIEWKIDIIEKNKQYFIESSVEDNGKGISSEFIKCIFEPFAREKGNTEEGSGLGLAITKNLIDLFGGDIYVKSQKGKGSYFSVSIPVSIACEENYIESCQLDYSIDISKLKGKKVLVCEDNKINQKIVEKILLNVDMLVDFASNGVEGVLKAKKNEYDVILMDIRMPIMDGLVSTREIRKFNNIIPIIAVSANAYESDIEESKLAGMNFYISKPIRKEILYSTIISLLKK